MKSLNFPHSYPSMNLKKKGKIKRVQNELGKRKKSGGMKLEINHKKKTGKITNLWRLRNMLLNNFTQQRNQGRN